MELGYEFEIISFRAIDEPELCQKFIDGHSSLLKDLGINKLTSADARWCNNPYAYVLLVKTKNGNKYIAGARLEIKSNATDLPVEEALEDFDTSIIDYVQNIRKDGDVGEICGLWISKDFLGIGLAVILLRADLSLALPLNVKTLLFLCSDDTKRMLKRMGCTIETKLGNNGTFYYPKMDLIATFMIIENIRDLNTATEEDRMKIYSLGNSPNQTCIENTPNCNIKVEYKMKGLTPVDSNWA